MNVNVTYVVNFIDADDKPLGTILLDSGAQINIENDITCFTGYLEPSDVKIGLANKNVLLRNAGIGTRRRRFFDTDGNVYIVEDRAYYCPDASHPIMSTAEWDSKGATILLYPRSVFDKTRKGTPIPKCHGKSLIIDKEERMIFVHKIPNRPKLWWLIPIQPTKVSDIKLQGVIDRNKNFAVNMLEKLNEAEEAPTVEDYATKVQKIKHDIEEAHLLYSQLHGADGDGISQLIASAHEAIDAAISTPANVEHGYSARSVQLPVRSFDSKHISHVMDKSDAVASSKIAIDDVVDPISTPFNSLGSQHKAVSFDDVPVAQLGGKPFSSAIPPNCAANHTGSHHLEISKPLGIDQLAQSCAHLEIVQQVTFNLQASGIDSDQAALTAINTIAKHGDTRSINSETESNPSRPVPRAEDDSADVR